MTAAVTLPLVGIGAAALKTSIDFESAFAGVRKTVDTSEEGFAQLRQGIRDMAKEMPTAATEIAGVAEAAGQLGIRNDAILGFTKVMVQLGDTTNISAQEAADSLARLANITQMPQDQFGRLGATVVDLGNKLASTESEIVDMGLRIAGAGHQIGLTEAQILGFAGALSSVGIEAEAGGSAISRTFIKISTAVGEGGDSLAAFAGVAGMTSAQFKQQFETDAAGAVVAFITGLSRAQGEGENLFSVLEALGVTEIRERDALLRLAGAGDLLANSLQIGTAAWESNTALTAEAEKRYATTEAQLQVLWNRLKDVAVTLGDALVPALMSATESAEPLIGALGRAAEKFANLNPATQASIIGIAGIGAALGPVLYIVGNFVQVITSVQKAMASYKAASLAVAAGNATMAQSFFLAALPVAAVVAALAVIGLALYGAYKHFTGFREVVDATWQGIQAGWDALTDFFVGVWQKGLYPVFSVIIAVFSKIRQAWDAVVGGFQNADATIGSSVSGFEAFFLRLGSIIRHVTDAVGVAWSVLVDVATVVWKVVVGIISTEVAIVRGVLEGLGWFISNVLAPAWHFLSAAASVAWDVISVAARVGWAVLQPVFDLIGFAIENVVAFFRHWWNVANEVFDFIGKAASFMWDNVLRPVFEVLVAFIVGYLVLQFQFWQAVVEAVADAIGTAISFMWQNVVLPVWTAIKWYIDNALVPTFNFWRGVAEEVWNAIGAVVTWIWENVLQPLWRGIVDFVNTWLVPGMQYWRDVVVEVWDRVGSAISWAWGNVIRPVWEAIQGFINDRLLPALELIGSVATRVWDVFKTTAKVAWDGLKDAVGPVLRLVGDAVGLFLGTVSAIARAVGLTPLADALMHAKDEAYGWGEGLARGGRIGGPRGVGAGFVTDGPTAVVGEGRRSFPEYVIPSDPAYAANATRLWMAAGADLFPGFLDTLYGAVGGARGSNRPQFLQAGGIIDWVTDAAGNVVEFVGGAADWTFDQVRKLARAGLEAAWPKLGEGPPDQVGTIPARSVNELREGALDFIWEEIQKKTQPAPGSGMPGGSTTGLDPEFLGRFNAWNASLGNILSITSGFRSRAEQQYLYDLYLSGQGNLAAPPGSSMHERGLAIDHSPSWWGMDEEGALAYRLHHPVGGEPWHVEPFDAGGILQPGHAAVNMGRQPELIVPLGRAGLTSSGGGVWRDVLDTLRSIVEAAVEDLSTALYPRGQAWVDGLIRGIKSRIPALEDAVAKATGVTTAPAPSPPPVPGAAGGAATTRVSVSSTAGPTAGSTATSSSSSGGGGGAAPPMLRVPEGGGPGAASRDNPLQPKAALEEDRVPSEWPGKNFGNAWFYDQGPNSLGYPHSGFFEITSMPWETPTGRPDGAEAFEDWSWRGPSFLRGGLLEVPKTWEVPAVLHGGEAVLPAPLVDAILNPGPAAAPAPWDNPFFNPGAWASREFDEVLTGPQPDAPTAFDLRDSPDPWWPTPGMPPEVDASTTAITVAPGAFSWAPRFDGEVSPAVVAEMRRQMEEAFASFIQAMRARVRN